VAKRTHLPFKEKVSSFNPNWKVIDYASGLMISKYQRFKNDQTRRIILSFSEEEESVFEKFKYLKLPITYQLLDRLWFFKPPLNHSLQNTYLNPRKQLKTKMLLHIC